MNIEPDQQHLHYKDVLDRVLDNGIILEASPPDVGGIGLTATHERIVIVPTIESDSTVQVSPLGAAPAKQSRS